MRKTINFFVSFVLLFVSIALPSLTMAESEFEALGGSCFMNSSQEACEASDGCEWSNEDNLCNSIDAQETKAEEETDTSNAGGGYTSSDEVKVEQVEKTTAKLTSPVVEDFWGERLAVYDVYYAQDSKEQLGDDFYNEAEKKEVSLSSDQVEKESFSFELTELDLAQEYFVIIEPKDHEGTAQNVSKEISFETKAHGEGLNVVFNSKGLLKQEEDGTLILDVGASDDDYMIEVYGKGRDNNEQSKLLDTIEPTQETFSLEEPEASTYNVTFKAVGEEGGPIFQDGGSIITSTIIMKQNNLGERIVEKGENTEDDSNVPNEDENEENIGLKEDTGMGTSIGILITLLLGLFGLKKLKQSNV